MPYLDKLSFRAVADLHAIFGALAVKPDILKIKKMVKGENTFWS